MLRKLTLSNVELTMIKGIGPTLAMIMLAEIGTDMSRWLSIKHFTSWL